jgi:UDP-N-acetylglucosamine acyltransferase
VGARNQIREYVNISVGTVTGHQQTVIGDDNLIMAYTHIAHDCIIVQIAGHVEIGNFVVFGGMSGGHQFCRFGDYAMIAAGSIVVQDVVPYAMVHGDHAAINGLNVVGLRRAGYTGAIMESIKAMNRILFKSNLTLEQAIQEIKTTVPDSEQKTAFVNFIAAGKRGLCR